jgi:hypothetical protein
MNRISGGTWKFEHGAIYSDTVGRLALADRENPDTRPVERDNNLRLMAAAPRLLEALEAARLHFAGLDNFEETYAIMDAVIARAKGDA